MKEKTLFVIPAYNEEKNIGQLLDDINKIFPKANILVVDDNSTDNTKGIVFNKNCMCISLPFNMGYSAAVQTGIKYAYYNEYDYVIQLDGDGQHIPKELKKLIKAMDSETDIVIGSRFLEKSKYKHPFFRKLGTALFSFLIKLTCHTKITDPTSGFQIFNRRVINKYASLYGYPEYPDANLIIEMLYDGFNIKEASVEMKNNNTNKSMHSGIIKPIKYVVKTICSIIVTLIINVGRRKKK